MTESIRGTRFGFIAITAALLASLTGLTGAEAGAECPMTYETFETAIPHLDAETCPDTSLGDKVFCRISTGGDHAHVFYFLFDGKQCLLKVESYDDDQVEIKFKKK